MAAVRFGLIGYGAWGLHHARAMADVSGASLVAVSARSEANQKAASAAYPQARVYDDYRRMLDSEELDVVSVVLPTDMHFDVGCAVLQSGRHLLTEKPMALSVDHCSQMIDLAAQKGRWIAVGHELRFSPLWGKVKQLVDAGTIGEPQFESIELWRRPYRTGSDGWRYDINRVGNWTLEEPIHFFDLARWYFAQHGDPTRVYAQGIGRQKGHPELLDNFSALMSFRGGRYALVSQTLAGWEHHQTAKITGTEGALWARWSGPMDRTFEPTFQLQVHDRERITDVPVEGQAGEVYELVEEMRMIVDAVNSDRVPACSGTDGRWSVAMCLAAQRSVDSKEPVEFAEM